MISVQQAVDTIVDQVKKFPSLIPNSDMRLEEFDFDGVQWVITMSFSEGQAGSARHYKTFVVDGDNGQLRAMRISPPKG